jgi:hypothetical protein
MPPGGDVRERFGRCPADYGVGANHRYSGLIPVGPPENITNDRAFLIGDAAAHGFTGEILPWELSALWALIGALVGLKIVHATGLDERWDRMDKEDENRG